MSYYFY